MKEFTPPKEVNEIAFVEINQTLDPELTRQEADDKVAALLEERRSIGENKISELAYLKRQADIALDKWKSLDKELKNLKSKRNYERDAKKKSELDKKISAKQDEVDNAKSAYENKKSDYQSYARRL